MGRLARLGRSGWTAIVLMGLTAVGALAGPVLSSGPYAVTMPGGGQYEISGDVFFNGPGYTYTYTVHSLNKDARTFELGLASEKYFWGNYTETNVTVSPGSGTLLHDLVPHTTILAHLGRHNYVFTNLDGKNRIGIAIGAGETVTLSFDDSHDPILSKWSLREINPAIATRNNFALNAGKLPVPSAPEPTSLALASIGLAGLGMNAWRRRRNNAPVEA